MQELVERAPFLGQEPHADASKGHFVTGSRKEAPPDKKPRTGVKQRSGERALAMEPVGEQVWHVVKFCEVLEFWEGITTDFRCLGWPTMETEC